jgi:hypothetical protein
LSLKTKLIKLLFCLTIKNKKKTKEKNKKKPKEKKMSYKLEKLEKFKNDHKKRGLTQIATEYSLFCHATLSQKLDKKDILEEILLEKLLEKRCNGRIMEQKGSKESNKEHPEEKKKQEEKNDSIDQNKIKAYRIYNRLIKNGEINCGTGLFEDLNFVKTGIESSRRTCPQYTYWYQEELTSINDPHLCKNGFSFNIN